MILYCNYIYIDTIRLTHIHCDLLVNVAHGDDGGEFHGAHLGGRDESQWIFKSQCCPVEGRCRIFNPHHPHDVG